MVLFTLISNLIITREAILRQKMNMLLAPFMSASGKPTGLTDLGSKNGQSLGRKARISTSTSPLILTSRMKSQCKPLLTRESITMA